MSVQVVKELITKWTYLVDDTQIIGAIANARHLSRAFKALKKDLVDVNLTTAASTSAIAKGWSAANTQLKLYKAQLAQVNAMHAQSAAFMGGGGYHGFYGAPGGQGMPYTRRRGRGVGGSAVGPAFAGWAWGKQQAPWTNTTAMANRRPPGWGWTRTQRIGSGQEPGFANIVKRPPLQLASGLRSGAFSDARSRFAGMFSGTNYTGRARGFAKTGMAGVATAGRYLGRKGVKGATGAGGFLAGQYLSPSARGIHFPNILRSAGLAAIGGLVPAAAGIGLASKREGVKLGLAGLLRNEDLKGTGEKTNINALLDKLNSFAAETPFQIDQLRDLSVRLIAGGFKSNEVIPALQKIGDSTGASADKMDRMITNLIQIKAYDQAYTRDIKQFGTAGVPLQAELMRMMGLKHGDSKESKQIFKKLLKSGGVDFKMVMQALSNLTGEGGILFERMLRQMETVQGRWSNLMDVLKIELEGLGEKYLPRTKKVIESVKDAVPQVVSDFGNVSNGLFGLIDMFIEATPLMKAFTLAIGGVALIAWSPIIAGFIAITAVLNDLGAFFAGNPSVTGDMVNKYAPSPGSVVGQLEAVKKKTKAEGRVWTPAQEANLVEAKAQSNAKILQDYTKPEYLGKENTAFENVLTHQAPLKRSKKELIDLLLSNKRDTRKKKQVTIPANNRSEGGWDLNKTFDFFEMYRPENIIKALLKESLKNTMPKQFGPQPPTTSGGVINNKQSSINVHNTFYVNSEQELEMAFAQSNPGGDNWVLEAWNLGSRATIA